MGNLTKLLWEPIHDAFDALYKLRKVIGDKHERLPETAISMNIPIPGTVASLVVLSVWPRHISIDLLDDNHERKHHHEINGMRDLDYSNVYTICDIITKYMTMDTDDSVVFKMELKIKDREV